MNMKKILAFVLSIVLVVTPASADLSTSLGNMLGNNIQVNSGGDVTTFNRGGFYGGSVYIRGQVTDINVLNFTPPSFASGCGGIDLFGGSFSMIDAAQFVALLRAIAQNAAAYAFQLALKNICEQCATIVAGLQKGIQAMNEFTGNSCQMAQGIVNDSVKALTSSDAKGMSEASITQGWSDAWEGFWENFDTVTTALDTTVGGRNIYEEKFVTNVTWQALETDFSSNFSTTVGLGIRQALMSMVGTIVIDGPINDDEGNPSQDFRRRQGNLISVRDLVYGNSDAQIYRCQDNLTNCLDVGVESYNLVGLLEHIEDEYIGTGPSDTSSRLWLLVNGNPTQQDTERRNLTAELGTIGSNITRLAKVAPPGDTTPWLWFDRNKEWIAIELAVLYIDNTVAAVLQQIAQERYDSAIATNWIDNELKAAVDTINDQAKQLVATIDRPALSEFVDIHNYHVLTSPFGTN